ncbi:DUF2791 family P-loop domain-containing protein [Halomonas sp. MCCC 1A17488]|nr:DUF2791 family P-loop domain-containing protein [Halomonas sp. MCCC 1A17488]MCG3239595.1 DUF2791 family P-loop domain-containing protein [Halomonas sp. MCCC 1A17488]QPP50489.1 DUF2791 family P-loop domain-containing protein [Halomonas sp. SS10-MC5]
MQIRLKGFDTDLLQEVGCKVRDLYAANSEVPERIRSRADDTYVESLAMAVTGDLGGKIGIAPRIFLKKLVGEVLDRIDQFEDFDPRQHYALTISDTELSPVERAARRADSTDDIELDL